MTMFTSSRNGKLEAIENHSLPIGQIFWLNGYGQTQHSHDRKAIYDKATDTSDGYTLYKWVNLDKPEMGVKAASEIRHASKLFGIGNYYLDNDFASPEEIQEALANAETELQKQNFFKQQTDIQENELYLKGNTIINENFPKNSSHQPVGLIIAALHVDKSNGQEDYFGYSVTERVILAWTFKKREDFKEMREACKNCTIPEIASLAEAPISYEHRENYSSGSGYYLGEDKYSGWVIRKTNFGSTDKISKELIISAGKENGFFAYTLPIKNEDVSLTIPNKPETHHFNLYLSDYSEKAIVLYGDTKTIKDLLKELNGKFNPRLKDSALSTFAGWIFSKKKQDQLVSALKQVNQSHTLHHKSL